MLAEQIDLASGTNEQETQLCEAAMTGLGQALQSGSDLKDLVYHQQALMGLIAILVYLFFSARATRHPLVVVSLLLDPHSLNRHQLLSTYRI